MLPLLCAKHNITLKFVCSSHSAVHERWAVCIGGCSRCHHATRQFRLHPHAGEWPQWPLHSGRQHCQLCHLSVYCQLLWHQNEGGYERWMLLIMGGERAWNCCIPVLVYPMVTIICPRYILQEENGFVIYENMISSVYEVGLGPRGSITRDSSYEWGGSSVFMLSFLVPISGRGPVFPVCVLKAEVPVQVFGISRWGSGGGGEYGSSSSPCLSARPDPSGTQARQWTVQH